MTSITRIAYQILGCSALFLVIWALLISEEVIDFSTHSNSRFDATMILMTIGISFGLLGLLYWMIYRNKKRIAKQLTIAHLLLTYGALFGVWLTAAYVEGGHRIYEQPLLLNATEGHQNWWIFLMMILALAQIGFLANLLIAATTKVDEKSS